MCCSVNSALGITGITRHEKFYKNVIDSFQNIEYAQATDYVVFMVFLSMMLILEKVQPGHKINPDGSQGPQKA